MARVSRVEVSVVWPPAPPEIDDLIASLGLIGHGRRRGWLATCSCAMWEGLRAYLGGRLDERGGGKHWEQGTRVWTSIPLQMLLPKKWVILMVAVETYVTDGHAHADSSSRRNEKVARLGNAQLIFTIRLQYVCGSEGHLCDPDFPSTITCQSRSDLQSDFTHCRHSSPARTRTIVVCKSRDDFG
jgi:hypothetical protein